MIERLHFDVEHVFGFAAHGRLHQAEVDEIMNDFDATISESYKFAVLVEYADDVDLGQLSDAGRFYNWQMQRGRIDFLALVGSEKWTPTMEQYAAFTGATCRRFDLGQRDAALQWLDQERS